MLVVIPVKMDDALAHIFEERGEVNESMSQYLLLTNLKPSSQVLIRNELILNSMRLYSTNYIES